MLFGAGTSSRRCGRCPPHIHWITTASLGVEAVLIVRTFQASGRIGSNDLLCISAFQYAATR